MELGLRFKPPSILLNKVKYSATTELIEEIHADTSFTPTERLYIIQAAKEWELFSNNRIKFNIIFDLNLVDYSLMANKSTIIRVHSSSNVVKCMDEKNKYNTLGLCYYSSDTIRTIYIVFDRLNDYNLFKLVAMHELGHYINLEHTEGNSIMNMYIKGNRYYPSYIDAVEYGSKWNVNPKDCKYMIF
jgi:hypothetical protein